MKGRRVRLFLRLTTDVNDRLRALMRYHGELSRYVDAAVVVVGPVTDSPGPADRERRTECRDSPEP